MYRNFDDEYLMHYGVKGMKWRKNKHKASSTNPNKADAIGGVLGPQLLIKPKEAPKSKFIHPFTIIDDHNITPVTRKKQSMGDNPYKQIDDKKKLLEKDDSYRRLKKRKPLTSAEKAKLAVTEYKKKQAFKKSLKK